MALDQVLKRHFWIVTLPLTAVAAFFGAVGVTQLAVAPPTAKEMAVAPLSARGATAPAQPANHAVSADPILSRNPFDSVTGPLNRVELPEETEVKGPDLTDPANAPPCDGVKVLVITASSDPEWSFAALQATGDNKILLRRRGGDIGGKTVEYVGWDRVWLSSGATLCQSQMFKPADAAPKTAAAPSASEAPAQPAGRGAPSVGDEYRKGIQKISATEYNVDRGVVDKILENQADLMRQARIVPEQENGKVVGIRMFGVRPDTLLGVLGMENGDRLQTINGFEVANPEKALEAYARLRTADKLTMTVNRRGQQMNLDYNIK